MLYPIEMTVSSSILSAYALPHGSVAFLTLAKGAPDK